MNFDPKLWPNTLYRYTSEYMLEGKTFARPDLVPEGEGWVTFDDLGPAPVVKAEAAPLTNKEAVTAGKRLVALERENVALKETLAVYEGEAEAKDKEISALRAAVKAGDEMAANDEAPKPKRKKAQ